MGKRMRKGGLGESMKFQRNSSVKARQFGDRF